jgi:TetR/AcrR family transcriptional repressor of nem operon
MREKLSGSAAALFQRFGYAHVSIRHITSSIDIPKGTFYNHFNSKEALATFRRKIDGVSAVQSWKAVRNSCRNVRVEHF